jgi:hypothetical protein
MNSQKHPKETHETCEVKKKIKIRFSSIKYYLYLMINRCNAIARLEIRLFRGKYFAGYVTTL